MQFVGRLGVLYAAIFATLGVQLPFLPVWLAAKGLDQGSIAMVLAVATFGRIATLPFATRAVDRFASLKSGIILAACLAAVMLTALAFADSVPAIVLGYAAAAAAGATLLPLVEAYALRGLALRARAYGPVRLWGSAAFIAGNLAAGMLVGVLAGRHFIWLLVGGFWLSAAAAALLRPLEAISPPPPATAIRPSAPFRDLAAAPGLVAVILASSLIQGSHAAFYGFGTLRLGDAGLGGLAIGALWGIGVAAEIALFALSPRLPSRIGPMTLLGIGGAGAALRWSLMALDPPAAALPFCQLLHGLSFGATHLGAVQVLARAAPLGAAATAQGLLAFGNGAAMAMALALAGYLQARSSPLAYWAMALMGAGGWVTVFVARQIRASAP